MKSFVTIMEEISYPRLRAKADGASETARLASISAGKKSTRNNHRIAEKAHNDALRLHLVSIKDAPESEKEHHKDKIWFHQNREQEHFSQSQR